MFLTQFQPETANAYAWLNLRECHHSAPLDQAYEESDLVFIGYLEKNEFNHSEQLTDSPVQSIGKNTPVRLKRDLTFNVLQSWKGVDGEQNISVTERYVTIADSRFEVGNTYLLFLNKQDEWGDEGWRIYECSKYEDLGRGDSYYLTKQLENKYPSEAQQHIRQRKTFEVNSGTMGDRRIFE